MTEAILEARKAYIHNEVPVGGLIVDNTTKSIIVRGYNKMNNSLNAINHCEISLISNACKILQSKYFLIRYLPNLFLYVPITKKGLVSPEAMYPSNTISILLSF